MRLINRSVKLLSTFFGVGYFPLIPGTAASLAALFLYYLLKGNPAICAVFTLLFLAVGFLVAGPAEKIFGRKDPRCIVIDEVAGMFLCLVFLPYDPRLVWMAFFVFRVLDTLKPYPAGRLQDLKGGLGVMADDIVAAVYTNLVLQAVVRLASLNIS
ncbi:phosphatidylglycerophosphatase A [Candidatus Omnitrophota bacterium]